MKTLQDCLRERGLIDSLAGEDIEKALQAPSKVYIGFDPTADSLHLGNLMGMVVLGWCQRFGLTPVILLGGATGKIGDPSGKSKERPVLEDSVLLHNISCIRKNFSSVLDFSGRLPMPVFVNNADWFQEFSFVDFLRVVGKHFRIGSMLAKESVKSRVHSEEGMSFTEFAYMLLQSYDFYHLLETEGVSIQMGGSDQWGNITAGIDLVRKLTGKPVYGLTFPLLTASNGKKFGKSEEGAIWLSPEKCSPYAFYQYLIGISDADVITLMKKLTYMDLSEIQQWETAMSLSDYVPNSAQKRLAAELTVLVHGEEGLQSALKITEGMAPGSEARLTSEALEALAREIPFVILPKAETIGRKFTEVAVAAGLVGGKGEATRLIGNRGAYLNQKPVEDPSVVIKESDLIGGKYFLLGSGKKKKVPVQVG